MKIRFYIGWSKKVNSTMIPDSEKTLYIEFDGFLKNATSINTPIMEIDTQGQKPYAYTYCEIVDFKKFYFIQDVVSHTYGIWDYYLTEDTLGTFRNQILATRQHVIRARNSRNWYTLTDSLVPLKSVFTFTPVKLAGLIDTSNIKGGCFCLGITNTSTNDSAYTAGSVAYYVMNSTSMRAILNKLISLDLSGTTGLSQMATFSAVNPIQYIVSCVWLPYSLDHVTNSTGGTQEVVSILDWSSGITAYRVTENTVMTLSFTYNVDIPKHPQISTLGSWVNLQASQYAISVRGYGQIPLDSIIMGLSNKLIANQYVDVTSGASVLKLYGSISDSPVFMNQMNAQIGISVQLSQVQKDIYATATIAGTTVPIGVIDALGGTQAITNAISQIASVGDKFISQVGTTPTVQSVATATGGLLQDAFTIDKGSIADKGITGIKNAYTRSQKILNPNTSMHSSGGHFSDNARVSAISDMASSLNSAITSYMHNFGLTTSSVGSTGSFCALGGDDYLFAYFQNYADRDEYLNGLPDCSSGVLEDYVMKDSSGNRLESFTQCQNPTFSYGNTFEQAKVLNYLSGGVFLV